MMWITEKRILRRHKKQPKELAKKIEKMEVDRRFFRNLIERATQMEPFDKKKKLL
ncbi:MAG: hypothetical protein UY16_C0023G0005 [Candidatus Gottesmanbacteria bacterium GW2011_GWA2_47_9]|uniref:Uncharacterized protein n=1 Tax=Candidatus Gottesmanbacteria bacterium GW2011_GWA2_47_9 TaxID=1618445 RepID=A0A0G1U0J2_9BACT|nr:MAG: hypothetical protein UY16_C0023G0005 [Candidatus Gottesmanbacteria bacterium GW2011_GWA2_47_9]